MSSEVPLVTVHQTDFTPSKGNALQACVATLLRLPLDSVPNFVEAPEGYEAAIRSFVASLPQCYTFRKVTLPLSVADAGRVCILRGASPRGDFGHVVVARVIGPSAFEMLCDPHPDSSFLDASKSYGWAGFIAPAAAEGS